jgi:hypothetical protein
MATKTKDDPKKVVTLSGQAKKVLTDLVNSDREVASLSTKATKLRLKLDEAEAVTGVAIRDRIFLGCKLAKVIARVAKKDDVPAFLDSDVFASEFWSRYHESMDTVGYAFAKSQMKVPTEKSPKASKEKWTKLVNDGQKLMRDYSTVAHQAITIVISTPSFDSGLAFVQKRLVNVADADWSKNNKEISEQYWSQLEARSEPLMKGRATVAGHKAKADKAQKNVDVSLDKLINRESGELKTDKPRKPKTVLLPYLKSK